METKRLICCLIVAMAGVFAGNALAKPGALIDMPGPKPQVAKSWKKLGNGKYEFTLDAAKGFTPADVKSSLERRLKKMNGVVTAGNGTVTVTFQGQEAQFLEEVSGIKIRKAGGGDGIALESSLADGGIRADRAARALANGEAKGKVVNIQGTVASVLVQDISPDAQKKGLEKRPIKFTIANPIERGAVIYFVPVKKTGDVWEVENIKTQ